jgi:hypothetical protein
VPPTHAELAALRERLETDDKFYAETLLQIVDQRERTIPLKLKPAQEEFLRVKAQQEAEFKPVRIIVLKARREGISTIVQGCMVKRISQRQNHKALVVAHDKGTAKEIFEMGETMYGHLPDEEVDGLLIRPPVAATRRGQEILLGEGSRHRRLEGQFGLNSRYKVDTANEAEGGRGFTNHSLHLSEFAFWGPAEKKMRALMQTLPEGPESMCVIESTANAYNLFRKLWIAAETGNSDYYPLFIPWHDDPDYTMDFANEDARGEFIETIGEGEFGEAEPDLVEAGVTVEQLNWRRWAIANKTQGDLRGFMQEYPSTPGEAFLSSGRQVFAPSLVAKVVERTAQVEPHAGLLRAKSYVPRQIRGDIIQVPENPFWLPEEEIGDSAGIATPRWRVWEPPFRGIQEITDEHGAVVVPMQAPGQYVITVDSASGAETVSEGQDYFVINVINHRTRRQCAVWRARGIDPDLVALEAYKVALWYSAEFPPWLGVETTGGYGVSIALRLYKVYRYALLYFRSPATSKGEKAEDRLGFSMDSATKPLVVDGFKELLRTGRDGVLDPETAAEMQTFVRDEKGKMGAEEDYFDDLIDAEMVGQYIASEKPMRRSRFGKPVQQKTVRRAPTIRRPRSRSY